MNTSFGQTLRNAREAKGLTTSQVAAQTRMLVQIVEEMEREDFHRIAAPIYGRGFVKLYAECVDLDPLPLVREFMDIYEGRRAPVVQTREVPLVSAPVTSAPVTPMPPTPSAPAAEPAVQTAVPVTAPEPESERPFEAAEEPAETEMPLTAAAPVRHVTPTAGDVETQTVQEPEPAVRGLDLFEQATTPPPPQPVKAVADIFSDSPYLGSSPASAYAQESGPSAADRFRTGLSSVSHGVLQTVQNIPRRTWRISALLAAALLVIGGLGWGCYKLFQVTSLTAPPRPAEPPTAVVATPETHTAASDRTPAPGKTEKPSAPAAPVKLRTTGPAVPTLYAD